MSENMITPSTSYLRQHCAHARRSAGATSDARRRRSAGVCARARRWGRRGGRQGRGGGGQNDFVGHPMEKANGRWGLREPGRLIERSSRLAPLAGFGALVRTRAHLQRKRDGDLRRLRTHAERVHLAVLAEVSHVPALLSSSWICVVVMEDRGTVRVSRAGGWHRAGARKSSHPSAQHTKAPTPKKIARGRIGDGEDAHRDDGCGPVRGLFRSGRRTVENQPTPSDGRTGLPDASTRPACVR